MISSRKSRTSAFVLYDRRFTSVVLCKPSAVSSFSDRGLIARNAAVRPTRLSAGGGSTRDLPERPPQHGTPDPFIQQKQDLTRLLFQMLIF